MIVVMDTPGRYTYRFLSIIMRGVFGCESVESVRTSAAGAQQVTRLYTIDLIYFDLILSKRSINF